MVQFVKGGPDIPEGLLHAHEQGRVVFFCGAGISRQAGLPGFGELVEQCYEELSTEHTPEQDRAIKSGQYDKAIRLLEGRLGSNHLAVRRTIAKKLHEHREQCGLDTHRALLMLARHQNRTRLITTNFDHLFEKAAKINDHKVNCYDPSIALLNDVNAWNGMVYLHGRMPELLTTDEDKSNGQNLADMVLSSKDFSQAYQIEGHVTHFIQRILFLRYTVCFVGYSLEDTMFQYLLDGNHTLYNYSAGQDTPRLYAFVGVEGASDTSWRKWTAQGVHPIDYYCQKPKDQPEEHTSLHNTLRTWAQSMDVTGKIKIIEDNACKEPSASTPDDDFAGRVLWALKDTSGKPAARFASLTPVPPLEWLVTGKSGFGANGAQSEIQISLFEGLNIDNHNDIIRPLSHWLARHLNDPRVIIWLIGQRQELRRWVTSYIQMGLGLKDDSGSLLSGLEPRAQQYWHLFLGGHVLCEPRDCMEFMDWQESLTKHGLTTASKRHLLSMLTPMLRLGLKIQLQLPETMSPKNSARSFGGVMSELKYPATDNGLGVPYWLENPSDKDNWHSAWQKALPELFPDFNRLLRDALDLLRMVGRADNKHDYSCVARFSISDHERDHKNSDGSEPDALGLYITLTRDAWLAKHKQHPEQAKADAIQWMREPYPVFKRLAFFAATQSASIEPHQALEWLLADDGVWLWSIETRREAIRLIAYLAAELDAVDRGRLEHAILAKPSQPDNGDIDNWDVYLCLVRLEKHLPKGAYLGDDAQARLKMLRQKNPKWSHDPDEDVEFPYGEISVQWIGEPGDGRKYYDIDPNRRSWVQWIEKHPSIDVRRTEEDGWAKFCDTHFPTAVCVLYALAQEDLWPETRWHHALDAWVSSEHSNRIHRSWRHISPLLKTANDEALLSLDVSLGAWILKATEQDAIVPDDEDLFIQLSKRLLVVLSSDMENDAAFQKTQLAHKDIDLLQRNRISQVSEALLVYWHKKQPKDNASLPAEFEELFTRMCDVQQQPFRCARVALASYAHHLFRVDPKWTKKHLLPLFDWDRDPESRSEACAVWQGYLRGGISDLSSFKAIKPYFLETAKHDVALGEVARRYYAQLINTFINGQPIFTDREYKQAIASLSPKGRKMIVFELTRYLRASQGHDTVKRWDDKVTPFFENVWPREAKYHSPDIAQQMEECCERAGERSEQARELLMPYIQTYMQSHNEDRYPVIADKP